MLKVLEDALVCCPAADREGQREATPVQEARMLGKVGVLLGGFAQDVPDLPQLQLAILAGVCLVEQLL